MLSNYAQLSSSTYARLFGSMHAYVAGIEALDIFCLSLGCPGVYLPRLV